MIDDAPIIPCAIGRLDDVVDAMRAGNWALTEELIEKEKKRLLDRSDEMAKMSSAHKKRWEEVYFFDQKIKKGNYQELEQIRKAVKR